jgi:hypothetical protein
VWQHVEWNDASCTAAGLREYYAASEAFSLLTVRDARPISHHAAPRPSSSARRWHSPQDAIKRKRYDLSVGDFEQARAVRACSALLCMNACRCVRMLHAALQQRRSGRRW